MRVCCMYARARVHACVCVAGIVCIKPSAQKTHLSTINQVRGWPDAPFLTRECGSTLCNYYRMPMAKMAQNDPPKNTFCMKARLQLSLCPEGKHLCVFSGGSRILKRGFQPPPLVLAQDASNEAENTSVSL